MTPSDPIPVEIKLHQKRKTLELVFDNGEQFELPCEYLRVFSTSAEVEAAQQRGQVITGKEQVNINKIEPVGNYAVNLHFDDGHSTGIYAWTTLYSLARNYESNWQDYLKRRSQAGFGLYSVPKEPASNSSNHKSLTLLYFISLAKRVGQDSEQLEVPATIETVAQLLQWLRQRGTIWEQHFKEQKLNITVNKQFAKEDSPVADGDEIAFVPKGI
ncbi:MAG: gamma-butyrobetaine hydroxylase-like domain-containing protein [Gammaproteobacteria bacterium]|nr:gamma-butyrobetaine hydroxylase-like domain-containing protein [Gammaproteobacteria bacterium]MDH5801718.1 gamma-butyrobetaine hydroxylase-like domain-containing protein [Gammaproteobacteria bacterium]